MKRALIYLVPPLLVGGFVAYCLWEIFQHLRGSSRASLSEKEQQLCPLTSSSAATRATS